MNVLDATKIAFMIPRGTDFALLPGESSMLYVLILQVRLLYKLWCDWESGVFLGHRRPSMWWVTTIFLMSEKLTISKVIPGAALCSVYVRIFVRTPV